MSTAGNDHDTDKMPAVSPERDELVEQELLIIELKQLLREALAVMSNEQQTLGAYRQARDELERRAHALLGDAHLGGKDE